MDELDQVRLGLLAEGAAGELFDDELAKVLRNIADVNTEAEQAREIALKVKMVPNEDRHSAIVTITVTSKLAGQRPAKSTFYMGRRGTELVAVEYDPKQMKLDGFETNLVPMKGGE